MTQKIRTPAALLAEFVENATVPSATWDEGARLLATLTRQTSRVHELRKAELETLERQLEKLESVANRGGTVRHETTTANLRLRAQADLIGAELTAAEQTLGLARSFGATLQKLHREIEQHVKALRSATDLAVNLEEHRDDDDGMRAEIKTLFAALAEERSKIATLERSLDDERMRGVANERDLDVLRSAAREHASATREYETELAERNELVDEQNTSIAILEQTIRARDSTISAFVSDLAEAESRVEYLAALVDVLSVEVRVPASSTDAAFTVLATSAAAVQMLVEPPALSVVGNRETGTATATPASESAPQSAAKSVSKSTRNKKSKRGKKTHAAVEEMPPDATQEISFDDVVAATKALTEPPPVPDDESPRQPMFSSPTTPPRSDEGTFVTDDGAKDSGDDVAGFIAKGSRGVFGIVKSIVKKSAQVVTGDTPEIGDHDENDAVTLSDDAEQLRREEAFFIDGSPENALEPTDSDMMPNKTPKT